MSKPELVLAILAFAAVTAVLYVWGLKRSMAQSQDLERALLIKCAGRVRAYLRKHPDISLQETAELISGVRAGLFWSRDRIRVSDGKTFAPRVLDYLAGQRDIEEVSPRRWRLKR